MGKIDQPLRSLRRQNLPVFYARNGPPVLATHVRVLIEQQSFYGKMIAPYIMSEEESVDIDTLFDLRLAEWLITQRKETIELVCGIAGMVGPGANPTIVASITAAQSDRSPDGDGFGRRRSWP